MPMLMWRTHSCVPRSHSCERVLFSENSRAWFPPYNSGNISTTPPHLSRRPLALHHLAPIRKPSPRPLSPLGQDVRRPSLRMDGPVHGHDDRRPPIPQSRTNRSGRNHIFVQGGGPWPLPAWGIRGYGQPRPRAATSASPAEPTAQIGQGLHGKGSEPNTRAYRRVLLATRVVRSLGSGRSGVGKDYGVFRGESCEGGGREGRGRISMVECERGVAGTRSHECERGTHECVRHIGLTTNRVNVERGQE
jgi:hypothetical protein